MKKAKRIRMKKSGIPYSVLALLGSIMVLAMIFLGLPNSGKQLYGDNQGSVSNVDIVVDGDIGAPPSFGIERVRSALSERGMTLQERGSRAEAVSSEVILVGTLAGSGLIRNLKSGGKLALSEKSESLAVKGIQEEGKNILVVAGADDRGLMYALLEIADSVLALPRDAQVFDAIAEVSESPQVPVRSMALFLHNRDDERGWYYSREYWEQYLGMLAADRYNAFNLVFSHQTPYLAPMYPFHVMVEEHPEVKVIGLSEAEREKNLEMLQFISSLAKDRGIDFTLGVWQQIAWGRETHSRSQESMVSGYNRQNMTDYTYRALTKLLKACPGISGLQLRLNYESGVSYEEQTEFFEKAVFRAAKESGRKILIEVRDIGLLAETLDAAKATGLPTRVSHKYWAEHLVFPYHPARFVWTYSYGDWLRYPRDADHIYQVWSLGSHRLLLWGDPEFVRRFAPTTTFGEAVGFEICAPLSQKGYGNAPGAWPILKDKQREYYSWEFQRYWSYYRLFGRLTYNPEAGDEIWMREIERRFGDKAAEAVARAYRAASWVVPFIAGSAISNYNMGVWPEKDMGGLINYYLHLMPFDKARFCGFLEYVDDTLSGRNSGRMSPEDVALRLEAAAADVDMALDEARGLVGGGNKEYWATEKDFQILAGMARYHAEKRRAAMRLGFYYRTGDVGQLRAAIRHAEKGLVIWKQLSAAADEIYSENLVFGPGSVGHWKDNIRFVEDDLKQLRYQEKLFGEAVHADYPFDLGPEPSTGNTSMWSADYTNYYTVEPRFRGVFPSSRYDPEAGYGWISGEDLEAVRPEAVGSGVWNGANKDVGRLPGEALLGDFIRGSKEAVFRMDLPEGHYQATVIIAGRKDDAVDHGPMSVTVVERFGERPIIESEVVKAGDILIKRFNFNMTGERFTNFRLKFHADEGADFIVNALTFTRIEPHIAHVPVRRVEPGHELRISACVTLPPPPNDERPLTSLGIITSNASTLDMPSGIARMTLKYSGGEGNAFRSLEMEEAEDAVYAVRLPAREVKAGKIRYFLEAEDSTGRVVRMPKENAGQDCFLIDVSNDRAVPKVEHQGVREHVPGKPLEVRARVTDDSAVGKVLLYYRPTRQTMEFTAVTMVKSGGEYVATIPGSVFTKHFDAMYYFEAFDTHGNACLYPDPDMTQPYFVIKLLR